MESAALWQVGVCLAVRGELDEAERTLEEAVDLARKLGDARSVGAWQKSLAGLALMRGDHARAWRLFDESLAIHRSLDDAWGVSHSLSNLAFLALEAGDAETARARLSEALAIERESGHHVWLANALEMSARLAAGRRTRRRSPFGCTPAPHCSARLRGPGCTTSSDGPTPHPTSTTSERGSARRHSRSSGRAAAR